MAQADLKIEALKIQAGIHAQYIGRQFDKNINEKNSNLKNEKNKSFFFVDKTVARP